MERKKERKKEREKKVSGEIINKKEERLKNERKGNGNK